MKADESTIAGMPEARLEWHLDNWRDWMRAGVVTDGFPEHSAVCQGGGTSATFEELVEAVDTRCAEAVDALISGLTPSELAAISHIYLHAVFRFPRNNLDDLLLSGRFKIAGGLVMRGFY